MTAPDKAVGPTSQPGPTPDDQADDGRNAWGCDHHPEWADDANRCHHPAHDQQTATVRTDDGLADVLPCDCEVHAGLHHHECITHKHAAVRAWHDARLAAAVEKARAAGYEAALRSRIRTTNAGGL